MGISGDAQRLDPQWIEAGNNVCGVVQDCRDAYTAAGAFVRAGWSRRSSSWYGWEVETGWGRIDLDPLGGSEVLLNGIIAPPHFATLATLLTASGLRFTLELYDASNTLLRETRG